MTTVIFKQFLPFRLLMEIVLEYRITTKKIVVVFFWFMHYMKPLNRWGGNNMEFYIKEIYKLYLLSKYIQQKLQYISYP